MKEEERTLHLEIQELRQKINRDNQSMKEEERTLNKEIGTIRKMISGEILKH